MQIEESHLCLNSYERRTKAKQLLEKIKEEERLGIRKPAKYIPQNYSKEWEKFKKTLKCKYE